MSEQPQGGVNGRRIWFLAVAVLAGTLISYTVVKLRHLSQNLPYDPGQPHAAVDVEPGNVIETLDRLRAAFLGGHSARVAGEPPTMHECWPLSGIERERAIRVAAALRDEQPGPLSDAVVALVDQRRAFVIEHETFPEQGGEHWRYWSHLMFEHGQRRRILVVPIDLREFPQVR